MQLGHSSSIRIEALARVTQITHSELVQIRIDFLLDWRRTRRLAHVFSDCERRNAARIPKSRWLLRVGIDQALPSSGGKRLGDIDTSIGGLFP